MSFHVGVDVGGTFTDLFAVEAETGRVIVEKADTTDDTVTGVLEAMNRSGVEPSRIGTFVFGSTIATNALVERKTEPVAYFGTEGFTDVLEVRRLWREHLFGWHWDRPRSLVPADLRFGIPGRIDWRGHEITPLDLAAVDQAVEQVRKRGIRAVAVSLMFSFLNPDHERRVRARLQELAPEIEVTLSHEVNPEIKEYERASTTVVAAGLSPIASRLLSELEERLTDAGMEAVPQVIKSNGGIMSAAAARTKPLELARSGPAGGVASAVRLARELDLPNLITVDIGGTTADVAVVTGGETTYTQTSYLAWDIPIRVPMADVRSVGAGGGSIASLDVAGRLHVGPRSAGAAPGPVCYGRGGTEPTVTDAALVAGLIDPHRFLGGRMHVDAKAAADAVRRQVAEPLGIELTAAASGIIHLASVRMAQLIGEMTVQVGLDPRDYTVVGFGGAGPMFVAALAAEMDARAAVVPLHPAVWSAFGGLYADVVHDYGRSHVAPLRQLAPDRIDAIAAELAATARRDLEMDGLDPSAASFEYAFDIRYKGQSHDLAVGVDLSQGFTAAAMRDAEARFETLHEKTFGHTRPGEPLQLVTLRLLSRVPRDLALPKGELAKGAPDADQARKRRVWLHGQGAGLEAAVWERSALPPGFELEGPAIIEEDQSNTVVPPGMSVNVSPAGHLMISRRTS